ncbi:SsrA-binding protein SmpB [Limnoglobus roseus]|uniref:SsrA-binding protein n=1 Tax=Limnoglobus roseus TaxID=2598579 RepID=A0A5C1ACS1_9BACT|nr:SsrA-binding protein SmpB [Limnoglobus roseus]QEL14904.1 SsrA-binding protein SmpB [Limnoglobus roseus]
MAKGEKKKEPDKDGIVHVCRNRRAAHEYEIVESLECGIALLGTEVKSLRDGHATLDEAYARIQKDELWLIGCEIPEYWAGNQLNHKPKRERKLLLHRRELTKFAGKASDRGFTLVPLRLYFKEGMAKVEIAVARGKQTHDKRHSLKEAEAKRDIARAMSRKRG